MDIDSGSQLSHGNSLAQQPCHTPFPVPIPRLSSMSSALARYESFLLQNVSTISSLESTLRSITWLLPGRFKDAELVSETRQYSIFPDYSTFPPDPFFSVDIAQCPELIP
jgi:peroxisomal membrane protein Pex16